MIVDNFELIKNLFLPEEVFNEDAFWDIRVIKRRKENPEMPVNSRMVKSYHVNSRKELEDLKPRIIKQCADNNARAYFDPNARSWKQLAYQSIKAIADIIAEERFKDMNGVIDKTVGSGARMKLKESWMKTWLVDVDTKDRNEIEFIKDMIRASFSSESYRIKGEIPTISGVHIATSPFDKARFANYFKDTKIECPEVKTCQPTMLYYAGPEDLW